MCSFCHGLFVPTTGDYARAKPSAILSCGRLQEPTQTDDHSEWRGHSWGGGERQAAKALAALVTQVEAGNFDRTKATVEELLDAWLEHPEGLGRGHRRSRVTERKSTMRFVPSLATSRSRSGRPTISTLAAKAEGRKIRESERWPFRFHHLRHASVTTLIAAGIDVRTLSERHGHAQATMTLNRYARRRRDLVLLHSALPGGGTAGSSTLRWKSNVA